MTAQSGFAAIVELAARESLEMFRPALCVAGYSCHVGIPGKRTALPKENFPPLLEGLLLSVLWTFQRGEAIYITRTGYCD
jgi:hypothetical protein